jgi:hypothetical protein
MSRVTAMDFFRRKIQRSLIAASPVFEAGLGEDQKSRAFPIETAALFALVAGRIQFGDNIFSAPRLGLIKGKVV